jgi:tetratricopeptide (TPR) repeat protein
MFSRSHIKRVFAPLAILALLFAVASAQEMDYNQEQYDQYTAAVKTADLAARLDAIMTFVKANPDLSLVQYALVNYVEVMQEFQKQGQLETVLKAGKDLLEIRPDDANALYLSSVSAFQLNKFEEAAEYGEKAYAQNPNTGLLYVLAVSNQKLKNDAKFREYAPLVVDNLTADQYLPGHLEMASGLRNTYMESNATKALRYARKILEAIDAMGVPQGVSEQDWKKYTNYERAVSYALLGQQAVKAENWSAAISNYQRVNRYTTDRNLKSEAYYFIGRGRWAQNRLDPAMEAFAMGQSLKGAANADACREYLERLYKATHNGSLAGLEDFIVQTTIK